MFTVRVQLVRIAFEIRPVLHLRRPGPSVVTEGNPAHPLLALGALATPHKKAKEVINDARAPSSDGRSTEARSGRIPGNARTATDCAAGAPLVGSGRGLV